MLPLLAGVLKGEPSVLIAIGHISRAIREPATAVIPWPLALAGALCHST